jgi:hypothetical protein
MSFYLVWKEGTTTLKGFSSTWLDNPTVFPINFPGYTTPAKTLTLASSAKDNASFETLQSVKLYLTGDPTDIQTVQIIWPTLGGTSKPQLNGGLEISFDFGRTYTRFDSTHGLESNSTTWLTLPKSAIGLSGLDGTLGPFDQAQIMTRYVIPPGATTFKVFDIRLAIDCDIV